MRYTVILSALVALLLLSSVAAKADGYASQICNDSSATVTFAIAYYEPLDDGSFNARSVGWYTVESGRCASGFGSLRDSEELYLYGYSTTSRYSGAYTNDGPGRSFCVQSAAFEFHGDDAATTCPSGAEWYNFRYIGHTAGTTFTYNLDN